MYAREFQPSLTIVDPSLAMEDHQMLTTLRVPDEDDVARLFMYAFEGKAIDF